MDSNPQVSQEGFSISDFIKGKISHSRTAVFASDYPEDIRPEVAIAGRSNVGKSSIINALLGRKALARVASTPGKTRQLQFYDINQAIYLVDLPGYGYAQVAKSKKAEFSKAIETYFKNREQIAGVVLLLDVRHQPTELDILMLKYIIGHELPVVIVLTKSDKCTRNELREREQSIRKALGLKEHHPLLLHSCLKKTGTDDVREAIVELVNHYSISADS